MAPLNILHYRYEAPLSVNQSLSSNGKFSILSSRIFGYEQYILLNTSQMPTTTTQVGQMGGGLAAFFILSAISLGIGVVGLVLGTEPRLVIERTVDREFRVSASNHFAGLQFYSKTINGVSQVVQDDAMRDRIDSAKENRKRRKRKHLDFFGADGARVGWDRESDQSLIEDYMRSTEKTLSLAEPPPTWRMAAAWFCVVLGALSFIGAIQNSIFPKKNSK